MLITLLLLISCSFYLKAQNEKYKALFLYNFTKEVEWPQSYPQGSLVIGVLGNSTVAQELENMNSRQKIGQIKVFSNVEEISNCQVIYVSPGKSGVIPQLLTKIGNSNTLIVSDNKGGIHQGSGINFILDGEKLKFEISRQHIEQKGLKVSTSLLNLGVVIN